MAAELVVPIEDIRHLTYVEGLSKLSTLPLTEVELVVRNPRYGNGDESWSKADRQDFAQGLRNILLDPKGAEIYARDQAEKKEFWRKEREWEEEVKRTMYRPVSEILAARAEA